MLERRVVLLLVVGLLVFVGASCHVVQTGMENIGLSAYHPRDFTDRVEETGTPFDDKFRIGPGDKLLVTGWDKPELTRRLLVLPDGVISYPLIGDITAEGLTPQELASKIKQAISQYDRDAQISVSVEEVTSLEYSVLGETAGQGVYPLTRRTTLLEAIAKAEGFGKFTDRTNVILIRRVDGKEKRYRFDFKDFVRDPDSPSVNVEIRPGDVIVFL